ncbi:MAG TPA: hypothetical protein VMC09_16745 [Anaerolineales bacterium]|nr:hypothetical protein [Anaerolineales bacterium]
MKQDRFLIGILIFIGLLVAAAVTLFFIRNQTPAYGPEDSPQGVLYNYAVALQLHDYERAYGYLADQANKPTLDRFQQAFMTRQLDTSTAALQVGDVQTIDNDQAWVNVTIQYAGNGVFNNGYSNTDRATLVKQNGAWKITYLPYPYWSGGDWYQPTPGK